MYLQLIKNQSEFSSTSNGQVRIIKGFASTTGFESTDRSGEYVKDPFQFDLVTFKNSPQLLLDHDYIKTPEGNSVAAGKVTKAIPSYIKGEDPTNSENWVVYSLSTDEFVSTWPKEKSATLGVGSQGLFVVAEVNNPFAVELVDKGELGAFSWMGYASAEEVGDRTVIKTVDLIEISMVHTQCEKSSTFILVDQDDPTNKLDIDFTDCEICSLAFMKSNQSLEDVKKYTKQFNLSGTLSENEDKIFFNIVDDRLDRTRMFKYCGQGYEILAAPKKKKIEIPTVGDLKTTPIMERVMDSQNGSQDTQDSPIDLVAIDKATVERLIPNFKIEFNKTAVLETEEGEGLQVNLHVGEAVALDAETTETDSAETEETTLDSPIEASTGSVGDNPDASAETAPTQTETTEANTETQPAKTDTGVSSDQMLEVATAVADLADQVKANSEAIKQGLESVKSTVLGEVNKQLAEYQKTEVAKNQQESIKKVMDRLAGIKPSSQSQPELKQKSLPTQSQADSIAAGSIDIFSVGVN